MTQLDKYDEEQDIIKQIYNNSKGTYGYRRITLEMSDKKAEISFI